MNEDINNRIREYICQTHPQVQAGALDDDMQLRGILDSLAVLGLIGFLEPEFSIQITAFDMTDENFESICAISRLVERLRQLPVQ